jgi:N-acetylmuramic acid 6-phosphate etherase
MSGTETKERLGLLPTEQRNPRTVDIDELPTIEMLERINDEDAAVSAAVRAALPVLARVVDAVAERFSRGGRLFYLGAGTSGRLGVLDASECPPTFSVAPGLFVGLIAGGDGALRRSSEGSEDSAEEGAAALATCDVGEADTVVGIAASGRTPWVLGGMRAARQRGALVVALTCAGIPATSCDAELQQTLSPMAEAADIAIELATGPEALTGSTRMKAGTATKLALNSLSTGIMIRTGAVYSNLMVNVQTTNTKLVDRGRRIVEAAIGCDSATAARLMVEAGDVKTAILMQKSGLPYAAAKARLKRFDGNLRAALHTGA